MMLLDATEELILSFSDGTEALRVTHPSLQETPQIRLRVYARLEKLEKCLVIEAGKSLHVSLRLVRFGEVQHCLISADNRGKLPLTYLPWH